MKRFEYQLNAEVVVVKVGGEVVDEQRIAYILKCQN